MILSIKNEWISNQRAILYIRGVIMENHAVFISYDHSEDVHYKRLLEAWDANSKFDFEFERSAFSSFTGSAESS